ncbi:oxidoreductase (plasmid) [Azospirillum argentinense]|uniref:Oxidoreductase n=1 Tax=Azospirillum argentinense TaxID=2970906 RepID=A0A060DJY9_9PROT|nr:Ldh family oxidoreductase [Azospirillum argentinense]AIB13247.1 oxidoreductase [Azospirillum argentinense]EZQ05006.1 oxidoreductase [Azospirillum argentinense]
MTGPAQPTARYGADALDSFCRAVLLAAGADEATADAATRAMMHGSRLGVDSHGVRLLGHYVATMTQGRVNPRPAPRILSEFGAVATLDADNAHGALGAYRAQEKAVELAGRFGIGAVAIRNNSHFGPAGAFALAAAEADCIGMAVCNSDSFMRLHDGAERFHGTNPIAIAVPVKDGDPWLFDMATSAIPYNRVQLYRSLGLALPEATASDPTGRNTTDPERAEMLAPLGGEFGFKGAGLAGFVEILSAVLTGMKLSFEILPMPGPDLSTPRGMGAFVMAIRPEAFLPQENFQDSMARYLAALRGSRTVPGRTVMAPGDREWAEAERRRSFGIPIDQTTIDSFDQLAGAYGIPAPVPVGSPV